MRHRLERDTAGRPDLNQARPWLRDIEDAQSKVVFLCHFVWVYIGEILSEDLDSMAQVRFRI